MLIDTRDGYSTGATVNVASGSHRITVTVGLGPNPRVAEEILSSIRPIG